MTYSKQRLREVIALKRAAVRRIQNGIGEFTVSSGGKYIRDFNREFQTFQATCQAESQSCTCGRARFCEKPERPRAMDVGQNLRTGISGRHSLRRRVGVRLERIQSHLRYSP